MQVERAEFLRLATLLFGITSCGERPPAPSGPGAPTPARPRTGDAAPLEYIQPYQPYGWMWR